MIVRKPTILKLLFLFIVLPVFGFSQEADSVGNYILKGTTVLPWTDNYRHALYQYGYVLVSLTSSDCAYSGDGIDTMSDQVISSTYNDSTLQVSIRKIANCTDQFLGEIEILGDSVINLITHGYGGHSTCICCFTLVYTIETEGINSHLRYLSIDGDKRTLVDLGEER